MQHLKTKDNPDFYAMQARDAINWLQKKGVRIESGIKSLDLGCGHGIFGAELQKLGSTTVFADESCGLSKDLSGAPFKKINLDKEDLTILGKYDLVICSNVYEHLSKPAQFLQTAHKILNPNGFFYLSWTNWLSPWGGHEFSPFHYLGTHRGHLIYDKCTGKRRIHTPYKDLFPTYIGETMKIIKTQTNFRIVASAPRYYPEFSFLVKMPVIREFFTWNCALLMQAK